ncbi:RES domain-containing protein [Spiribacter vilamensis]|nr:RES domain-containing protein [Spiribacter vilamensis]
MTVRDYVTPIYGRLYRVVGSQERIATNSIVDTLEEQSLLENLLEASKPPIRPGSVGLHYLLMTPFRHPPLRHGSRFGGRYEPSIFYGAHRPHTARAEMAYYRLVFWSGMLAPPERPVRSEHTLYGTRCRTQCGLQLQRTPFSERQVTLTDSEHYGPTQALGAVMRAAGILAFEFTSARDPSGGTNVGLFEPQAFASTGISDPQQWLCEVDGQGVRLLCLADHSLEHYSLELFLVDGRLPAPAV